MVHQQESETSWQLKLMIFVILKVLPRTAVQRSSGISVQPRMMSGRSYCTSGGFETRRGYSCFGGFNQKLQPCERACMGVRCAGLAFLLYSEIQTATGNKPSVAIFLLQSQHGQAVTCLLEVTDLHQCRPEFQ